MRQWELERQEQSLSEARARLADTGEAIDYITISRQQGSGGKEIARILGELLNWQVYDKEILNYMAENMHVHASVLESVDGRTTNWIEDCLSGFFMDRPVGQWEYARHLVRVLLVIARHGRAIILGRAAGLILPSDRGLSVRVAAPFELRCARYAEEKEVSVKAARALVEKADREQQQFGKKLLREDVWDCKHYDIVCNTAKLSATSAAKLIWRTLDQRKVSS